MRHLYQRVEEKGLFKELHVEKKNQEFLMTWPLSYLRVWGQKIWVKDILEQKLKVRLSGSKGVFKALKVSHPLKSLCHLCLSPRGGWGMGAHDLLGQFHYTFLGVYYVVIKNLKRSMTH